jgi:hypothetical protein
MRQYTLTRSLQEQAHLQPARPVPLGHTRSTQVFRRAHRLFLIVWRPRGAHVALRVRFAPRHSYVPVRPVAALGAAGSSSCVACTAGTYSSTPGAGGTVPRRIRDGGTLGLGAAPSTVTRLRAIEKKPVLSYRSYRKSLKGVAVHDSIVCRGCPRDPRLDGAIRLGWCHDSDLRSAIHPRPRHHDPLYVIHDCTQAPPIMIASL